MEVRGLIVQVVTFVTLFFLVASWFILLGGVSRIQKVCPDRCRERTGLYWWIVWFQFFVLILWPFTQLFEDLRHARTSVMALFAILATLEMLNANDALNNQFDNGYESGYKTAASGFIILATFNLVAILLEGFLGDAVVLAEGGGQTTTYNNPVAKSGGSGAPDANMRPFRSASNTHGMNVSQPAPASQSPPPAV